MAAILQLRRGEISDFTTYGTYISEPYFDTDRDSIHIGTISASGSSADFITIAKLSLANRNSTKAEVNSGSFWITGDYTGSNMHLSGDLTASGDALFEGDVKILGHMQFGDNRPDDIITVTSEFSGSLIPDNADSSGPNDGYHDLGAPSKRWNKLYLRSNTASGSNAAGFISASHIDLTGNIKVDELGTFRNIKVDTLTDNRIILAGPSGQLVDDENLTFDGTDFRLDGDYYQEGAYQLTGSGDVSGSWTITDLSVDNGIVFTNANGTLENEPDFTWDSGLLNIAGGITASEDISVGREAYLASAVVEDLTEHRVTFAGTNGELTDSANFTFDGNTFDLGQSQFTVNRANGNTHTSGTLDVDGQSTLASANIEDLTDDRIVIVGAGGELEDDENFTFNGTELNIGTGNFTIQQGSGNTQIVGTLDVDSQSTLSSLNVEDLTSGRVVLAGTSGEIEDSGNLTFDGTDLVVTGNITVTQNLTVQGDTTQLDVTNLNVEDKNILLASGAADATAADGGGLTIDGADATLLYGSSDDSFTFNKLLKVNGNISGSSFNGTTLLSSSNENFADYSQSVDSRLDEIEGPLSTSLDTRLDAIEGPMSTSLDSRLIEIFATGSDHETRLDLQEAYSSSFTSNDLDMNGNKVLFGNVYSAEGDLPNASTYHGMFAHVHGTGKGYFAHGGNWIPLLNESTFTTDSASFDSRLVEIFATGSDHETRVDELEATGSDFSIRIIDLESTGSEHETRIVDLESTGSDHESRITSLTEETSSYQLIVTSSSESQASYLIPNIITGSDGDSTILTGSYEDTSLIFLTWTGGNGTHTLTLPDATTTKSTYRSIRFLANGTVSSNKKFELDPFGSQLIDGSSSAFDLDRAHEGIMVWSDGENWYRIQSKA